MNKNKLAFTIVELIVVIAILAILWTIAFISLQWYSKTARNSTRISDLSAMKTSLELFHLDSWKYPDTTDWFEVLYSWSIVWTQWTFGEATKNNVNRLDKIPKDPLTDKEYTYSLTKTKQEYELAWLMELDELALNLLLNQTKAGDVIATAIVIWNYNGVLFKTETWWTCELLSVPSIISAWWDTTTDLKIILDSKSLVYNGYNNLPSNYVWSKYKTDEWFEFESKQLVVYSDTQQCKPLYAEDPTARIELITNLQTAYSWTIIENGDNIRWLINLDVTDINEVTLFSTTLVNNNLWGNIPQGNTITIPTTINWECWTANKTYAYTDTTYWTDTFCSTGTPNPATPNFPTEWSPVNWDCEWTWTPVWTTTNCSSEITATPINWVCWTANNVATLTAPSTNLCSEWIQTSVISEIPQYTWSCEWINLWTNVNCSAPRQYTVTFNANGWTTASPSTKTVIYNTSVWTLSTTTRTWYTFNWWYTATSWWTQITTWNVITGNVTYYAQWSINPYASCTAVAQIKVATSTYTGCNTADIIVCSWVWTWYTIAACNVWATIAGTTTTSYWELFQWWNNAGTKTATASPTQISVTSIDSTYNGNWYFIYDTADWNTTRNDNLWWNWTNTDISRKWPCITWYHVPSLSELTWMHTAWWWWTNWLNMSTALKLPKAGRRSYTNAALENQWINGYYWASTPYSTTAGSIIYFDDTIIKLTPTSYSSRAFGLSVRCFRNQY